MIGNSRHIILILFGVLFFTLGCLDPFSFEREDRDDSIVIDGQLKLGIVQQEIKVSNVLTFGDKFFDPVPGLKITLHSEEEEIDYIERQPGIHIIPSGLVHVESGRTYFITATLPNGEKVSSQPDIMPTPYELDNVSATFSTEFFTSKNGRNSRQRIVEVAIDAKFPETGEDYYLRYSVEEDYSYSEPPCGGLHQPKTCYINRPTFASDFALFNSEESSKSSFEGLVVMKRNELSQVEFRGLHYFSVAQNSITKRAYEYWLRVKDVTNQKGTVFDLPPAAIPGNFINETNPSNQILGYFELAAVAIGRTSVIPPDYFEGAFDSDECSFFNRRNWPSRCCQCLLIDNSTTERPPWF